MKLQLIRNATLRVNYAWKEFVIDPFLAPLHSIESFAGVSPNPTVDLPCAPGEVVDGVDMVIVSHLHPDHFDPLAQQLLPNDVRMFCQPGDEGILRQIGQELGHGLRNWSNRENRSNRSYRHTNRLNR